MYRITFALFAALFTFSCQSAPTATLKPPVFERVALQHASAQEIVAALKNHINANNSGSSKTDARVSPDARTNSVLISGPSDAVSTIKGMITIIDVAAK